MIPRVQGHRGKVGAGMGAAPVLIQDARITKITDSSLKINGTALCTIGVLGVDIVDQMIAGNDCVAGVEEIGVPVASSAAPCAFRMQHFVDRSSTFITGSALGSERCH